MRTLTLALMALVLGGAAARADDEEDRKKLEEAFKKMVAHNKDVGAGSVLLAPPEKLKVISKTPLGDNAKNIVRVWARLYEVKPKLGRKPEFQEDYLPTNQYVSVTTYKWKPDQAYRLCFESGTDVWVSLFNMKDGKPGELLMPDKEYQESMRAIPLGTPFEMPITFTTEKENDETLALVFATKGHPNFPNKQKQPDIGVLGPAVKKTVDQIQQKNSILLANKPRKQQSQNIDDVAAFAVLSKDNSDGLAGMLKVVFQK